MPVNQTIVAWITTRVGTQIGNGECWTMVETTLRESGARTSNSIMGASGVTATADYVWGTPTTLANLAPGDIIQMKNYRYSESDGAYQTRPHHSAIVEAVWADGVIDVFECNVNGSRRVQQNTLYFQSGDGISVSGRWWFYRPIPRT
jgi:hypothetical protein